MKLNNLNKNLLAITLSMLLVSCGGGGGSSDNSIDGNTSTTTTTLSGVAAKGIIIGGLVVADELNADKTVKNAQVGTSTTDANGDYSLTLNDSYTGGPLEIKVTTDANSQVVCDSSSGCGTRTDDITDTNDASNIAYGEKYKPGVGNLTMKAILPSAGNGETISVQITPFTHMAASQALSASTLSNTEINSANSAVSDLLGGLNILTQKPIDVTNLSGNESSESVAYAALSASMSNLAPVDGNGRPNLTTALDNLVNSYSGGVISAKDNIGSDSIVSLQEIVDETNKILTASGATDTSGVLNELQTDITNSNGGTIGGNGSGSTGLNNIQKAKAFITDLRTWGTTIDAELNTPRDAFSKQIELADNAMTMVQSQSVEAINYGTIAITKYFAGEITSPTQFFENGNSFTSGTLSKTSTDYTLTNGVITLNGIEVTISMTLQVPADGITTDTITYGIKNISSEDSYSKIVVTTGQIEVVLAQSYTVDYSASANTVSSTLPNIQKVSLNLDLSLTYLKTVTNENLHITSNDPITLAANLTAVSHIYNGNDNLTGVLPGSLSFNGTISNTTNDSLSLGMSLSVPNASTIVKSPVRTTGVIEFYNETQPLIATLGYQFKVQLDGLPEANVSVTGSTTAHEKGVATLSISYGNRKILFDVSNNNAAPTEQQGFIEITNQDNVKLLLTLNDSTTEVKDDLYVTINGNVIATIVQTNGISRIEYTDNTFENL